MKTIYVLVAAKVYDASPKVLRAFHTEADAIAMKDLVDACNPSRAVEIFPTQIEWPEPSLFPPLPPREVLGRTFVAPGTGIGPAISQNMADA